MELILNNKNLSIHFALKSKIIDFLRCFISIYLISKDQSKVQVTVNHERLAFSIELNIFLAVGLVFIFVFLAVFAVLFFKKLKKKTNQSFKDKRKLHFSNLEETINRNNEPNVFSSIVSSKNSINLSNLIELNTDMPMQTSVHNCDQFLNISASSIAINPISNVEPKNPISMVSNLQSVDHLFENTKVEPFINKQHRDASHLFSNTETNSWPGKMVTSKTSIKKKSFLPLRISLDRDAKNKKNFKV